MHHSSPSFSCPPHRSCPFSADPDPSRKHALPVGSWPVTPQGLLECIGAQHVLHVMWMVLPNQAGSLQGVSSVNCILLAANDLGTGSGWQQSRQNWTLPAVVGYWIRMTCSLLCCAEDALLQSFFSCPARRSWPFSLARGRVKTCIACGLLACQTTGTAGVYWSTVCAACHVDGPPQPSR